MSKKNNISEVSNHNENKIINIDEEIIHKKESLDIVRDNRIMLSKRMNGKSFFWDIMFFLYNFTAIFMFVLSLYKKDDFLSLTSGIYSIYIILLQYTINLNRYHEKHQLARRNEILIEKKILRFKKMLLSEDMTEKEKLKEYTEIMDEYLCELEYFPNHEDIDLSDDIYEKLKKKKKTKLIKFWLKLKDNLFEVINLVILIVSILIIVSIGGSLWK